MDKEKKTALQKIESKLTGDELINLGLYINTKQIEAQKDLLYKLIGDIQYDDKFEELEDFKFYLIELLEKLEKTSHNASYTHKK